MEVNKDIEGTASKGETVQRISRRTSGSGKVTENFDEIITEKREDGAEETTERQYKEKGFSIQRAWCCLMNRRTS